MYENEKQILENDILVLYIINSIGISISEKVLTEIVLTPGLVNYFSFQDSLQKLIDNKFIDVFNDNDGLALYGITDDGKVALSALESMLTLPMKNAYDQILLSEADKIKAEMNISAYHFIDINGNNAVRCYLRENGNKIVDIKFPVPDKDTALEICANWKSNAYDILSKIINDFT